MTCFGFCVVAALSRYTKSDRETSSGKSRRRREGSTLIKTPPWYVWQDDQRAQRNVLALHLLQVKAPARNNLQRSGEVHQPVSVRGTSDKTAVPHQQDQLKTHDCTAHHDYRSLTD